MDKKIAFIIDFLKKMGIEHADCEIIISNGEVDYIGGLDIMKDGKWASHGIKLSPPLDRYIEQIADDNMDEIGYVSVDGGSGYFQVNLEFHVGERKLVINSKEQVYGEDNNYFEYDNIEENNPRWYEVIKKLFDQYEGVEYFELTYEGSGDNGYIDDQMIDSKGNKMDVSDELKYICNIILGKNCSGWEINEGSQGQILIYSNLVEVNHTWFVEKWEETNLNIVYKV